MSGKGHFHLNPPPYSPGQPQFYGVPDNFGAIYTDECAQADKVIRAFGKQGPQQQAYVNAFFNGEPGSPPVTRSNQIGDIGDFFTLDSDQAAAINSGCANTRPEFMTGASIAPGHDAAGEAVAGVWAYSSAVVSVANVGTEYTARCNAFQRNLNAGGHGGP